MCTASERYSGHTLGYAMEPGNNSRALSENIRVAQGRWHEAEELTGGQITEDTVLCLRG